MVELLQVVVEHVDLRHVLVLNLVGWMFKCFLRHLNLSDYTDVIPVILALIGVGMAALVPVVPPGGFIIYGLANASVAWLLHQLIKATPKSVKKKTQESFDTITQPLRALTNDKEEKK